MQYVIYGADAAALTANQADALALQARVDTGMGYPHGSTSHAVGIEPNVAGTAWGVAIPQIAVWSWSTNSYVSVSAAMRSDVLPAATEFLTVAEINALKPFQYLVDAQWWGGD